MDNFNVNITFNRKISSNNNGTYQSPEKPSQNVDLDFSDLIEDDYSTKRSIDYDDANGLVRKAQGYTETRDYIYVSSHYQSLKKSRLYVYDRWSGKPLGYITLNTNAHVGGISYDKDNDILYVTGNNGEILAYDNAIIEAAVRDNPNGDEIVDLNYSEILNNAVLSCKIHMNAGRQNAATCYYYDGVLYVSTFDQDKPGVFRAYKTVVEKHVVKTGVTGELLFTAEVPPSTQGIAVTEYNGKKYLLTTQSMGSEAKGMITVYEVQDDGSMELVSFHYAEEGIEGIQVDERGDVAYVSEFGDNETEITTMDYLLSESDKVSRKQIELILASSKAYALITASNVSGVEIFLNQLGERFGYTD